MLSAFRIQNSILAVFILSLITFSIGYMTPVEARHFPWDQNHDSTEPDPPPPPGPCTGFECENDPDNCRSTGSPVYLATGYFIWSETDIELKGRPRLAVTRTFNSHDPRTGMLGNGWSTSCDQGLVRTQKAQTADITPGSQNMATPSTVIEYVRRLANGKRYVYTLQDDGSYRAPGIFNQVVPQGDGTARLVSRDTSYMVYSATGRLISHVDRNGNAINFTYNTNNQLTQKADTNGRALNYQYNAQGLVEKIQDHTNRTWQYQYDDQGNLIAVVDPLGGTRQYAYQAYAADNDGQTYSQLTQITDETGVVTTSISYTGAQVATYTELENTYTYQHNLSVPSNLVEDATQRIVKRDLQGAQWTYYINESGQIVQTQKPLNRTETYVLDDNSLPVQYTDPEGTVYQTTYDQYSNVLTRTDDRGTITNTYQADQPWVRTMTTRSGRVTSYDYDAAGNVTSITDPANQQTQMTWSSQGDLLTYVDPLSNTTRMTYSPQGQMLTQVDALNRTTTYTYDALNNPVTITNPAGETVQMEYDTLDRLIRHTDANGDVTTYQYDAADRITQITNANNQRVAYEYDTWGRQSKRIFYDDTETTYSYRSDNLVSQRTIPGNLSFTYNYDAAKRLASLRTPEETFSYSYNQRDQITTTSNSDGSTVRMAYDAFGRTVTEEVNGQTSTYSYNAEDEVTSMTALDIEQAHTYDNQGLLTQISANGHTYNYQYDAADRLSQILRSSGVNTTYGYDAASQITAINHAGQRSYQYQYDPASRISQWQGIADETRNYSYDETGRLQTVTASEPQTYQYDALGNRLNNNAQFDAANRITEDNNHRYTYDIRGNRTEKVNKTTGETERYGYNSLNQLKTYQRFTINPDTDSLNSQPEVSYGYRYDPYNRRIRKQSLLNDRSVIQFYWTGTQLIGEQTNTDPVRRYVVSSLTPQGFVEEGTSYDYLIDHLYTAHEMVDDTGVTVWQGDYASKSFGEVNITTEVVTNNLRFPGQYADAESGLYYNYYRNYDPQLGRYLQSDPIGLGDGPNTYSHVKSNPLKMIDSIGLSGIIITPRPIAVPIPRPRPLPVDPIVPSPINNESSEGGRSRGNQDPIVVSPTNPGRGPDGNCNPCPSPPPPWEADGNAHGSCNGKHWHWIEYNQNKETCKCFPIRRSGPYPPWA